MSDSVAKSGVPIKTILSCELIGDEITLFSKSNIAFVGHS